MAGYGSENIDERYLDGFKVCRKTPEGRYVSVSLGEGAPWSVEYPLGEPARFPRGSAGFFFRHLEDARRFRGDPALLCHVILRCRAVNCRSVFWAVDQCNWQRLWAGLPMPCAKWHMVPTGTWTAEELTAIEEVRDA
jgi:hypothetical protein